MQDVGCFGRIRSETDRKQARARAERVNESTQSTAGIRAVWGYFGRQDACGGGLRSVPECSGWPGKSGRAPGERDELMDLADDLHEKGGNERAAVWHARRRP